MWFCRLRSPRLAMMWASSWCSPMRIDGRRPRARVAADMRGDFEISRIIASTFLARSLCLYSSGSLIVAIGSSRATRVRESRAAPPHDQRQARFGGRTMLRTRMADSTGSLRPVPAVEKTARILRALAEAGRPQGISELARALKVSKGTLRDILLTLAAHGFVVRDPDTRFRLGPQLRALADASSPDLRALAQPYLVSLMETFGETAILGLVVDGKLEIAARAEPATDLHMTAPLGRRLPLEKGAHGKVLATREEIGYDDQELFAGVRAVAAPIVDARGRRIAVIMVVGFKERVDLRTLRRIGERCASAARALSQRIGAQAA